MIRVFVGCAASGEDAESLAVLEYSIRKHASEPVEIEFMKQTHDPASFWHGWATERWATPFSGFRWGIPAFCGYKGRAIYTDSDVIFLADIAGLWRQSIPEGKIALGKGSWRLCVSLWDCERAASVLSPIEAIKGDPMAHSVFGKRVRSRVAPFVSGDWNCLDGYPYESLSHPALKALHYTDMSTQPHLLKYALPRLARAGRQHWFKELHSSEIRPHPRADVQALFDRTLAEATADGYPVERYVPGEWFGDYRKRQ